MKSTIITIILVCIGVLLAIGIAGKFYLNCNQDKPKVYHGQLDLRPYLAQLDSLKDGQERICAECNGSYIILAGGQKLSFSHDTTITTTTGLTEIIESEHGRSIFKIEPWYLNKVLVTLFSSTSMHQIKFNEAGWQFSPFRITGIILVSHWDLVDIIFEDVSSDWLIGARGSRCGDYFLLRVYCDSNHFTISHFNGDATEVSVIWK